MEELSIGSARITLVRGDITEQRVHAIVNAANSSMLGGGGVDGAIHRKGGSAILEECRALRRSRFKDGLPTGEAASTTAGRLPARRVIHVVGPVWRGGDHGERDLLAQAYRRALVVAREEELRVVAFPSISTGAYAYPIERASRVALRTVAAVLREHAEAFDEVRFVLFSEEDYATYAEALAALRRAGGAEAAG